MAWEEGVPLDLKVILIWLLVTPVFIFAPYLSGSFLRPIIAIPMVIFIPGYMVVAILFPEKTDISGIERIAVSVGLSIALVPLVGLVLNYTVFGIRLVPVVLLLEIITLILWVIAYQRKIATGLADSVVPNVRNLGSVLRGMSGTEKILSYLLIGCVVMALGTTLFVFAVPRTSDQFTEFYLISLDSKPISDSITANIGDTIPMSVGIRNQEFRTVDYTIEVYLTKADFSDMRIVSSFPVRLEQNEIWEGQVNVTVPDASFGRVDILLFAGGVPQPDITGMNRVATSYRNLYRWLSVNGVQQNL